MRDADDVLARHAERDELLHRSLAVNDDPIDRLEHSLPELYLLLRPSRQDVVSREDDRPNPRARLEPTQVVARHAEPLDVEHVGLRALDLLRELARVRRVLDALREIAEARAGPATEERRAVAEEDLVLAEAVRRLELGEEKSGAEEVDLVPASRERAGEAAVVRDGVADGVG